MNEFLLQTSWWIPIYGSIGAVLTLPWSMGIVRRTGPRPATYFNLLTTLLAFVHGLFLFRSTWGQAPQQLVFHWLTVADLDLSLSFEISQVSTGAMELVTGLSLIAQLYALGYMEKDWALARFFGMMGFFEGAMSGLAISNSLFLSYALLEMLTLSTYLIVGFWYAQPLVVTAARDAFLTKRVGDILLLMGVVSLSALSGSMSFSGLEAWSETQQLSPLTANLLGLALIAGPIGKCAQFPLHLWLDEAMEGPNPASVLRNSLVVSCGAYVLIKLQPILALSPLASTTAIVLGTLTAIGASLVAIAQIDIKRTLSHSTSAYFGLVFIAIGMQHVDIALLLILTHALAKALLFISTGSVILTTNNQNITEMGGLWSRMPATTIAFVVGVAGSIDLFPLGMFWVLRRWVNGFWSVPWWLVAVLVIVNGLTAFNLTRVFTLVFLGKRQAKTRRAPEVGWPMALPLVSLTIATLLVPVMLQHWQFLLSWTGPWARTGPDPALFSVPLLVLSGVVGCVVGGAIYMSPSWPKPVQLPWPAVQNLLAYDFYIDRFYHLTVVFAVEQFSKITAWIDRYFVDGLVNLVGFATIFSGQGLKYTVPGRSQLYVLTILVGISVLGLLMSWLL
ncbi:MAG: NAD(P)H-quinone oxidoreductase subunit F [Cyanobacteria bacterium J007]|nr:MAG: NAD(P)H-quinone oxidoreductase subunit F [Cyanobacteria bacterium J007]